MALNYPKTEIFITFQILQIIKKKKLERNFMDLNSSVKTFLL